MGVKIGEDKYSWRIGCYEPLKEEHLNYHSSWNWLMPVVEKIIKDNMTDFYDEFDMCKSDTFFVTIGSDGAYSSHGISKNSLIEATWLAVVEFIKWYNTQTK